MSGKFSARGPIGRVFFWPTVFAFLIAATPHISCRCPGGILQPFCLSWIGKIACCGQTFAASRPCCGQHARSNVGSTDGAALRIPACCQSVLAVVSLASESEKSNRSSREKTAPKLTLQDSSPVGSLNRAGARGRVLPRAVGPVVDRIIAFQRLTI